MLASVGPSTPRATTRRSRQEQRIHRNPASQVDPRGWIERLARFQERPWPQSLLLLAAAATCLLSVFLASKLQLKTSLGELLPRSKESVLIAERNAQRLATTSLFIVVAEGSDDEGLKRFVDAAAPALATIDPRLLTRVDKGVHETRRFLHDHRFLYAPVDLVREIHDEIMERYDYEVLRGTGAMLEDAAPPPLDEAAIRERISQRIDKERATKPGVTHPGGYYLDPGAHAIAILLRTPIASGDIERSQALTRAVQATLEAVDPKRFDPTIRIGFTGDVVVSAEEYTQAKSDLSHIGIWGVCLILSAVLLFYLRIRPLVVIALTVGVGTAWTFAVAYLAIGYLNTSSGLLLSIVVGNGINFGIIYMSRYMEARRCESASQAIRTAHRETWVATLAAAAAAATAYGSLVVTDFRGFKHFGIIGGSGMLLCWLATYLLMPAILILTERLSPMRPSRLDRLRALYGRPFAFLVERAPRTIAVLGLCAGGVAIALSVRYGRSDPIEYDLSNIRNSRPAGETEARRLSRLVSQFVSLQERNGLAILTDSVAQVQPLKESLEARRDRKALSAEDKPFGDVVTIYELLPRDQEEKARLVNEVVDRLRSARSRGMIPEEAYGRIRDYLPTQPVRPIGIDDLPAQVARSFEDKSGERGKLVYVVPTSGRSVWDAHYLVEWADSIRSTTLPDGTVIKASNSQVIFADMFLAMLEEAPKAMIVSVLSTLLLVILAFRGRRGAWWVLGSLVLGLACMIAGLSLWPGSGSKLTEVGLKLNFLNFIALPITIGIGADYAINIVQRHQIGGDAVRAVRETGGAVVLCSLTTILGYLALTLSVSQAVKSFGIAAALGEVSCVVAAVLVLPAVLRCVERRRSLPLTSPARRAAHGRATAASRSIPARG